MDKLNMLLEELKETKKSYAYGQNHLLDTTIARVEELLLNKTETEINIGY